jgi:hypothetical protein
VQILRLHGRPASSWTLLVADGVCVLAAATAVVVDSRALAGAVAVLAVVGFERVTDRRVVPPKMIGIRQTVLGLLIVLVTALGVRLS